MRKEKFSYSRDEIIAMKLPYNALLKFPEWPERRQAFLASFLILFCNRCHRRNCNWEVHHIRYDLSRLPWEYEDWELELLCDECHTKHHQREKPIKDCSKSCSQWQELYSQLQYQKSEIYNQICIEPRPDSYDDFELKEAKEKIAEMQRSIVFWKEQHKWAFDHLRDAWQKDLDESIKREKDEARRRWSLIWQRPNGLQLQ